jgi:hypothetical protein
MRIFLSQQVLPVFNHLIAAGTPKAPAAADHQ